jgi:hypothetical protein
MIKNKYIKQYYHNQCQRCEGLFWSRKPFKAYHLWCNPICLFKKAYNFILEIVDGNDWYRPV